MARSARCGITLASFIVVRWKKSCAFNGILRIKLIRFTYAVNLPLNEVNSTPSAGYQERLRLDYLSDLIEGPKWKSRETIPYRDNEYIIESFSKLIILLVTYYQRRDVTHESNTTMDPFNWQLCFSYFAYLHRTANRMKARSRNVIPPPT